MALTVRAERMMSSLPYYYRGEPLVERIVQAWANEVDRLDAIVDRLKVELQPGAATDEFGVLGMWEQTLGLPPRPADATVLQRQAKVGGALQAIGAGSSADVLAALQAASGGAGFTVLRNTPGMRQDTIEVPFESTSYNAGLFVRLARRMWPAHRQLFVSFAGGFLFDTTPFDEASA